MAKSRAECEEMGDCGIEWEAAIEMRKLRKQKFEEKKRHNDNQY